LQDKNLFVLLNTVLEDDVRGKFLVLGKKEWGSFMI
jgi:hypothetical protein